MRLSLHRSSSAHRLLLAATAALAAVAAPPANAAPPLNNAPPPANADDAAADQALADRFEAMAQLAFPAKLPTGDDRPFVFAQQAATLSASAWLDQTESRYFRNAFEALQGVGEPASKYAAMALPLPGGDPRDGRLKGQIVVLNYARAAKPDDEFAWARLVDLHLELLETAPQQISYLNYIAGIAGLPADIKAYALFREAVIEIDRGAPAKAQAKLAEAIVANPLCGPALRLQYRLLPANAKPLDREQILAGLLQANPLQPGYARDMAALLADAGLVQESLPFFELSASVSFGQSRPDLPTAVEWAAEQFIAGQAQQCHGLTSDLLLANPEETAAWYVDLLAVRSPAGGYATGQQALELQRATNAMSNRVAEVINAINDQQQREHNGAGGGGGGGGGAPGAATAPAAGGPPRATTRPVEAEGTFPLPDVAGTADLLVRLGGPPPATGPATMPATMPASAPAGNLSPRMLVLRAAYIEAVNNLAWLEIYFARQPANAAPLIDALAKLLPTDDPLLAQLQGWSQLVGGNAAAAQNTFVAAAGNPLAEMGIVQCLAQQNGGANAPAAGRLLLANHPSGLVGAFLSDGLSGLHLQVVPQAGQGAILQAAINNFPVDLARNARMPTKLYSLQVEPVDVGRDLGQPLLVRVTLFNNGPADLTFGADGYIHPGLLFDLVPMPVAPAAGGGAQPNPTAYPAFDTWAGPLVVHRNGQVHQVVRVDQTPLLLSLNRTAAELLQVDGEVATNPGNPAEHIGGYGAHFYKKFARTGLNQPTVAAAVNALSGPGAPPRDRLTAIGQIEAYVRDLRAVPNLAPNLVQVATTTANLIRRARTDPSPAVSTWAAKADFDLAANDNDRAQIIRDLAANTANWRQRQLALLLLGGVTDAKVAPALQEQTVNQLLNDPESSVRAYATADRGLLDMKLSLTPPKPKPPAQPAQPPAGGNGALPVPP